MGPSRGRDRGDTLLPAPQGQRDVLGLQDRGDQVLVVPRSPQCSARVHPAGLELGPRGSPPASLSSAAASEPEPCPAGPRAPPALRKHLGKLPGAVTFRGQYTGGCCWRSVVGLEAATLTLGTLATLTLGFGRDTVRGGHAKGHPGTPRRAGHLGVSPMSQEQDGIR